MSDAGEAATSLEEASAECAGQVQSTVDGVLAGERSIVSRGTSGGTRFVVGPADRDGVPLLVAGERLATLTIALYLSLDRSGRFLKTVRSDLMVKSTLDRTPLLRLDYRADTTRAPMAHWQVHAERGAFSHLLARAHAQQAAVVSRPHDLSSLHLPVGGERFRPCLEDMLQFLIQECGVDARDGWVGVLDAGRERWRRRQLRSAVRDMQSEAAGALREQGWEIAPRERAADSDHEQTLRHG